MYVYIYIYIYTCIYIYISYAAKGRHEAAERAREAAPAGAIIINNMNHTISTDNDNAINNNVRICMFIIIVMYYHVLLLLL